MLKSSIEAINLIPYESALYYCCIPLSLDGKHLRIALAEPENKATITDLEFISLMPIKPVKADKSEILFLIEKSYAEHQRGKKDKFASKKDRVFNNLENAPVVELVNKFISEAIHRRASDIHCEQEESSIRIRFRIDGMLNDVYQVPLSQKNEFISRLKIMAGMDIAEKRRPQDGRIQVEGNGKTIDIRVSSLPTEFGEKLVLRILDKSGGNINLESLGLEANRRLMLEKAVKLPYGIILITGPTGSGKTTTLYAAMNFIKHPGLNISTVEDPIEYNLSGINQTQVNPEIGLTFAASLRSILRQDPNVIMVGEIRDNETADMAIRSGLTGHLVFSTLHTNDAASAVTRLLDMGVEPYLVSSTVVLLIAQRLVRRICEKCKAEYKPDEKELEILSPADKAGVFYKGRGCSSCLDTGYKGRIGLFEIMPVSETIKEMINKKMPSGEIKKQAISEGLKTLREDGIDKARAGITSLEEVIRETGAL